MLNLQTSLQQQGSSASSRFGSSGSQGPAAGKLAGSTDGQDQFGAFLSQLGSKIHPNLNAPALPYTATQGWSA
jgi:hypothetical protein